MEKLDITVGSITYGFELITVYELEEYRSLGLEFIHQKSGLKLFHIYNDDIENTFSFSFNTPVETSNGIPHIIEHSVLSGSRKYDLKDPFQAMMTGSVNTFLNAYTFPDKTSYPASSVLEKDFFNLMSVYGDAVFFPRLTKKTFLQEGVRTCIDDKGELYYSGVVYNEMKGVYSSHDSIVADMSVKSLFTEGVYTHDSGGDPSVIPTLTYEEFIEFHKKWYNPSNCYFYLYGNIPTEKTLKFLDDNFLNEFEKKGLNGVTISNEVWNEPQTFHKLTPALEDKPKTSDLLISWKLFDNSNPEEALALEILNKLLLGSSAAPLHKALIDNDLWADLSSSSGLENELCNFVYTVGVRGASSNNLGEFRDVVLSTLNSIVKNGFNKDLIEGSLRGIEFKNREIQGSLGLRLMRKVIRGWLHGTSPILTLEFDKYIKSIRIKSQKDGYFENLIQKYLLDNKHRADVVVEPSLKEKSREEDILKNSLKSLKKSLSIQELDSIRESNRALAEYQSTPDSAESLAIIPRLTRNDIPNDITYLDTKRVDLNGYTCYLTNLYTNGIVYFGLGFNMEYLDKFFFQYMLIFTRVFTQVGFKDKPYDEVSKLVSLYFGGISTSIETSNTLKDGKPNCYIENFYIRGKVLENSIEDSMKVVLDFLTKVDFHDYKRLKSIILELRNDIKSSLIPNGSSYAALRSARKFSLSSCREESWYGVTQAQFLENLIDEIEENEDRIKEVAVTLDGIKKELITRKGLYFHCSSDSTYQNRLNKAFNKIIEDLPNGDGFIHPVEHYDIDKSIEGFIGNSKVSYTGLTVKGAYLGSKEYAAQSILCYILKTGYLWENVRMKGGAYGVFVSPSGLDGAITFGSYRDPKINETLDHFKLCLEWIAAGHISQEEIDLALISVIGKELKPLTPIEKSITGMRRIQLGITDKVRLDKRSYLMDVSVEDLKNFAAAVLHYFSEASTVILSSKDALLEASKNLKGLKDNLATLPS